jgi:hypothetical protein
VDDRTVRGRLVVACLVLYVALVVALTVVNGMVESWFPAAVVAVLLVVALVFVLVARSIAGPGWRRYLAHRSTGLRAWDLLFFAANGVGIAIGTVGAIERRGDLPALLVVGLVAAAPVTVVLAVRFWWWLPRVAAARARQDSSADDSADDDVDPGRG